ncbi:hypothetical protein [Mucilaginibacter koreensis]
MAACVFYGCSNKELAYNEKTTDLFLNEMRQIDDVQKSFADSVKVLHADAGDLISLNMKAENTQNNARQDIQNMQDLKPSDAAKNFHESVLGYFGKIQQYGITAKAMLSAGGDKKAALYALLMNEYKALNQMPDQVLAMQKKYLDQAGLKAK